MTGWVLFMSKGRGWTYDEWIEGVYDSDEEAYEVLETLDTGIT